MRRIDMRPRTLRNRWRYWRAGRVLDVTTTYVRVRRWLGVPVVPYSVQMASAWKGLAKVKREEALEYERALEAVLDTFVRCEDPMCWAPAVWTAPVLFGQSFRDAEIRDSARCDEHAPLSGALRQPIPGAEAIRVATELLTRER